MTETQSTSNEKAQQTEMFIRAALWDSITRQADAYRIASPQNAEEDLIKVASYCAGLSVERAARIICCSEDDIRQAIIRVQNFVQHQELNDWWQLLLEYIRENPPNFGDCNAQGILEMLYETYRENNKFDDIKTQIGFKELYRLLDNLNLQQQDPIIYAVCDLCHQHQRTGFTEGIRIGIRLADELRAGEE